MIIVPLQGRFHTRVKIGSDKVLVGRSGVGRGIFHHRQPRFGKCVAQIVYRIGKFREHNEFTLWLVLHFFLDNADEGVQLGVVLDCVVLAKPLFAQTFEQSDVRLNICHKIVFHIFHVYLKEPSGFVLFEKFFDFFHAIVACIIESRHIRQISFLEYRYLVPFLNPSEHVFGRLNHVS